GTYQDNGTGMLRALYDSIVESDEYFVLEDFASYRETQDRIAHDYKDKKAFYKKGYMNMVNAGKFSSDRTIENMPVKSGTSAKNNNMTTAGTGSDARTGCCHITYSLPPSRRFSSSLEWSSSTRMMETE